MTESEKQNSQPYRVRPVTANEIYTANIPTLLWTVGTLLHVGLTLLCARPKAGKSWAALQISLAIVLEKLALGKFPVERPGKVLYFALEDTQRRLHDRLRQLLPSPSTSELELLENLKVEYALPPTGRRD